MRQKDVPRELLIGDSLWLIKFVRMIEGAAEVLGLCSPDEKIIYIKQKLTPHERACTLAHELIHAVSYEYGYYHMPHHLVYKLSEHFTKLVFDNFI